MENEYLKILTKLENRGIDVETDITEDVEILILKIRALQPIDYGIEAIRDRYVDVMSENRHITKNIDDDGKVLVRLKYEGLDYLNQYRLNKSLTKSVKYQIAIGIITMLAIVMTALYTKWTYEKNDLKPMYTLIQSKVRLLDSNLRLQKERNTFLKTMANRDSIRVSIKKK